VINCAVLTDEPHACSTVLSVKFFVDTALQFTMLMVTVETLFMLIYS